MALYMVTQACNLPVPDALHMRAFRPGDVAVVDDGYPPSIGMLPLDGPARVAKARAMGRLNHRQRRRAEIKDLAYTRGLNRSQRRMLDAADAEAKAAKEGRIHE